MRLLMRSRISTGIVDHGFGSVLAVAFVIAAVIYPFYSSYQNMKSGTQAPKVMGDAQDDAAIEKALKALTEAANALEAKKKQ